LRALAFVDPIMSATDFVTLGALIQLLALAAWTLPNSLQILAQSEPALGVQARPTAPAWAPSLPAAIATASLAAIAIYRLGAPSEFLYWQF
jgi:hypothetical protein